MHKLYFRKEILSIFFTIGVSFLYTSDFHFRQNISNRRNNTNVFPHQKYLILTDLFSMIFSIWVIKFSISYAFSDFIFLVKLIFKSCVPDSLFFSPFLYFPTAISVPSSGRIFFFPFCRVVY